MSSILRSGCFVGFPLFPSAGLAFLEAISTMCPCLFSHLFLRVFGLRDVLYIEIAFVCYRNPLSSPRVNESPHIFFGLET